MAVVAWGDSWKGRKVALRVDNSASVSVINSGVAKDGALMAVLRDLHFEQLMKDCEVRARHVRGEDNVLADLASRLETDADLKEFLSLAESAYGVPLTRVAPQCDVSGLLCNMRRAQRARGEARRCRGRRGGASRRRRHGA